MSKSGLLIIAAICFALGVGSILYSKKVMCVFGECIIVTSGDNLFNATGTKIDSGTANLIQTLPYITFGASGAFLIAGLVKSDKKS
jgi:phosphate/sulfate permease